MASLEQLLEAKQVEVALILKGDFTDKELELVRRAFDVGYKLGKENTERAQTGVDSQPPTRPQGDTSRRKEDATP